MTTRTLSVTLALTLVATGALAQAPRDSALVHAVSHSITTYPRFTIFDDLSVTAQEGTVTLRGKVTMPFKRDDIQKRVERITGVDVVKNEIEVLPVSIYDEKLRRTIARAIYGNPSFWRYAAMANPPIHIVVENGRVTLTGVVSSEVDRTLARSLATGHGGFSVVNALRTDADARSH